MAERKQAHAEACAVLDKDGDLAIDYGDALHLVTVLQRAIASYDPYLFSDTCQKEPIDARDGFNELRHDAQTLAHLSHVFYDYE